MSKDICKYKKEVKKTMTKEKDKDMDRNMDKDKDVRNTLDNIRREVEFAEEDMADLSRYGSGAHELFPLGTISDLKHKKYSKLSRGDTMDLGGDL